MSFLKGIALIFGIYLLFAFFEIFRPVEKSQPMKERLRNMLFMLVYLIVGGSLTYLLFSIFPLRAPEAYSHSLYFTIPITFLAVFIWDLIFYWYHRAEHKLPWLWKIHRFHHSDSNLNASSTLRHSWLEHPIQEILISIPIGYALHLDAAGWFVVSLSTMMWLFFIHTNWRLHLGVLTPFIGGPQIHRIHHSSMDIHRDKNFAVFFPIIDIIFGTYHAPGKEEFPPTGVNGIPSEASLKTALVGPFLIDR
jgi:sterol desaturase/sphingolipid hydroxylase (fatty acid hydroxylase superfamily)